MVTPTIAGQGIGKVRVVHGGVAARGFVHQRRMGLVVPRIKVAIECHEVSVAALTHQSLEPVLMLCAGARKVQPAGAFGCKEPFEITQPLIKGHLVTRWVIFATDNGQVDEGRNYPARWGSGHNATPEIGFFPPNPAGLFGMLDYMAFEWVNDWYQPDYYKRSPVMNPPGPETGAQDERKPEYGPRKVARGLTASSPAFGGFTFSRAGRWPYRRELSILRDVDRLVTDPSAGYGDRNGPQFRCVVNRGESPAQDRRSNK